MTCMNREWVSCAAKTNLALASEVERGIGRVATLEEVLAGKTMGTEPAFVTPECLRQAMEEYSRFSYDLCEFYYFRNPKLRDGFELASGQQLSSAAARYPEAWAYLQTTEGQALCVSESEWQSMSNAPFATLADGTQITWAGIGGVPFFVLDTASGLLRLPDIRGMYAEAAGFDALEAGGVHGDTERKKHGSLALGASSTTGTSVLGQWETSGVFAPNPSIGGDNLRVTPFTGAASTRGIIFDPSRLVPTGNKAAPRAWGALPCVFLGKPAV